MAIRELSNSALDKSEVDFGVGDLQGECYTATALLSSLHLAHFAHGIHTFYEEADCIMSSDLYYRLPYLWKISDCTCESGAIMHLPWG